MFTRLYRTGALWMLTAMLGCGTPNPNVRVRRLPDGRLEVPGPLAGPFRTLETLATNACELMTRQAGASNGTYGFEYCALHYFSEQEDGYFLSYLSDIGGDKGNGTKYCEMPRSLMDPAHEDAIVLGGAHTHPYPRAFSKRDTSIRAHWFPVRFAHPATGRIWDRRLMVFFRGRTGACMAYDYNNATRMVSALREGQWVAIGKADDNGDVHLFEGEEWLP